MAINTAIAKGKLISLYRACVAASTSLEDALLDANDALIAALASGSVLVSTAGNGHAVSFQPLTVGLDPTSALELVVELIRVFELAETELIAGGNATPSDAQIYAVMLLLLVPATEVYSDFTQMRYGGVPA